MKLVSAVAFSLVILFSGICGFGGQKSQEPIVEEVNVVNVLVPVRVFLKTKPGDGLNKEDFTLLENGK